MSELKPTPETVRAILADYGGEGPFFVAWVRDQVDPAVVRWFWAAARNDPRLRADLESLTPRRQARKEYRTALELTNYLTEAARPGLAEEEDSITALTMAAEPAYPARPASPRDELWRRIRQGLFQLLAAVDIDLPASVEVREGGRLLRHLAGPEPVERFAELTGWLDRMRQRVAQECAPALVRMLCWLAPDLFVRDDAGYHYRLSFRLYLRERLRDWCERADWRPAGWRYVTLDEAFESLDRSKIGELVRSVAEAPAEAVAEELAVAREAVTWLCAAP